MKPTVGRIVHYQTRGTADGVYPSEARAAIVTATAETCPDLSGDRVSLMVFFQTFSRPELNVPLAPDPIGHSWHWPERV